MPRTTIVLWLSVLTSCVSSTEQSSSGLALPASLAADPRFVARRSLALGAEPRTLESVPFSHRSRKWHVYPVTVYGPSRFAVQVTVNDARMARTTGLWVLGPRHDDGTYPTAAVDTVDNGVYRVEVTAPGYGRYAIVVGPREATGFLPRYPSRQVMVRRDGQDRPVLGRLDVSDSGPGTSLRVVLAVGGDELRVVSPLPANQDGADPAPGAAIVTTTGESLVIDRFWVTDEYLSQRGETSQGNLGFEEPGLLTIQPPVIDGVYDPAGERRYRVVEAVGADGAASQNPLMLKVVPVEHDGRPVQVRPCDEGAACAVYAGSNEPVPDDALVAFRPTFLDADERSTYDLRLECRSGCARRTAAAAGALVESADLPRYPVYFEHGSNETAATTWGALLAALRGHDPRWSTWADAADLPFSSTVAQRAEVMRRHLTRFIRRLEDADSPDRVALDPGETFLRVNVIAHSMGGLDARMLVGDERFNERCGELACADEDGRPEACCPSDSTGRPVPWRERIASITTESTPHCGSGFADWGLEDQSALHRKVLLGLYRLIYGLDEPSMEARLRAYRDLSSQFCEEFTRPQLPAPVAGRQYRWACATGQESCDALEIPSADRPVRAASGAFELPPPVAGSTTVYSWAGESCITGTCGDVLDPRMLVPYRVILSRPGNGPNDGLVSTRSAAFGIFMGTRAVDHADWFQVRQATYESWLTFGADPEPADAWHLHWLERLTQAGY